MPTKAIIAGASGLIGSNLLKLLLDNDSYDEVVVLTRKTLDIQSQKLVQLVIDFDDLERWEDAINGNVVFCCLGTTRAKTPDLAQYRRIDHDYALWLAQFAAANGVKQFHLVSAMGANPSSANFYNKIKGETERDVSAAGIEALHIYRPSLLTGERKEKRVLEQIFTLVFKAIDPLLIGGLKKYQSIPAATVAMAMFKTSLNTGKGVYIHPSNKIKEIA